jgi:hypothetical protein
MWLQLNLMKNYNGSSTRTEEDFTDKGYMYVCISSNDLVILVLADPSGESLKYGAVQWNPFNSEIQTIARQMNDTSQSVLLSLFWQCPSWFQAPVCRWLFELLR